MPIPAQEIDTIAELEAFVDDQIIPNGQQAISGTDHNTAMHGVINQVKKSILNYEGGIIHSTGGDYTLVAPFTVITNELPTSLRWDSSETNTLKEYYIKNALGVDIPLAATFFYLDSKNIESFVVPAGASIHIAQLQNGNWIQVGSAAGESGEGGGSTVPPVVNAGPDRVITLPVNNVFMAGQATSAYGAIKSITWDKITGPTTYNIVNKGLYATEIRNLIAGTYVFRMTAITTGGILSTDDMTILVNPAEINQAPVANAGNDIVLQLPQGTAATLNGGGSDDADGNIISQQWSLISAPEGAEPAISIPNQLVTSVINMNVPGTYEFELSVTDNAGLSDTDRVLITVQPEANGLDVIYLGKTTSFGAPTPAEILAGISSFQDAEADVLADWTPFNATPEFLWVAIPNVGPNAIKNVWFEQIANLSASIGGEESQFATPVLITVDGTEYSVIYTNGQTQHDHTYLMKKV